MTLRPHRTIALLLATIFLASRPGIVSAQSTELTKTDLASAPPAAATSATTPSPAAPFTARVAVDTRQPVSYGDDVLVSLWITPHESIDLANVTILPKGDLEAIYQTQEVVAKDLSDKASHGVEYSPGTSCRISGLNHVAGVPFVVPCRLPGVRKGWRRWIDFNSLLDSGQQQFEIHIELQEDIKQVTTYSEVGTVEFVSPKTAVILGGFIGSLVLSLLTFCITPLRAPPDITSWKEFGARLWNALPQSGVATLYFVLDVGRRALLGGVTAMVLIILFKSSEGFETPISIHIQDFWGGLLVGLVSVNLAKWVIDKLNAMMK